MMVLLKNAVKKLRRGYQIISQPQVIETRPTIQVKPRIVLPGTQTISIKLQPQVETLSAQQIEIPIQLVQVPVKVTREEATPVQRQEVMTTQRQITEVDGFRIPSFSPSSVRVGGMKLPEEETKISLTYPLIPKKPEKGETIFAYAKIFWDPKANSYVYNVVEPELSDRLRNIMKNIKELLEQKLDIEFSRLRVYEAKEYLKKQINEIITYFGFDLSNTEKSILQYYTERDFIGLGKIEPLMNDEQIEDISCDGLDIPIFVFHRNSEIGSIPTNVMYGNPDELDSFLTKLAQISGKSISVAEPLLSGSLPDGSRIQATLATDIARRGSNFTIRKFTEEPLTPIHFLKYGTVDIKMLAYLWMIVDFGKSVIISGGTASGKTSFLNVLSLFIRPEKKIVSIEDTPELKLPHPHWVPHVARVAIGTEGKKGEIDLFDLLKESLRQRPDYIVVGEVRGKEAYVLFQEMATGHPSLATIHAENVPKLIDRLTTPPISLPPALITSADVIAFLAFIRYREKQVRRTTEVLEIVGYDFDNNVPITNQVFKWNPVKDSFDTVNKSITLKKIADNFGLTEKDIIDELERRMFVLEWMLSKNISEYKDVHKILNIYYASPEKVISAIMGGR
jgi:flagellar protein FlaI